jgi:hypothetical protein
METAESFATGEDQSRAIIHPSYLGFHIEEVWGLFIATPEGWSGESIFAASLPLVRRRIWKWWYHIV